MANPRYAGFKHVVGDASNPTTALVLEETSRALHICEASDAETDWNVAAATHPSVFIHSATTPATDYVKIYHDATNGYIDSVGGNLILAVAGTSELTLTATGLAPSTTGGSALGTTALMWANLFLASGGVINFNNGNATITHSAGVLTVDGAAMVFNEAGADLDFRVETDGMAYAVYADGAKNALVLGSNTDTSSADQLVTISRPARANTAATSYYDLLVAPAGAVTTTGVTAVVASIAVTEPNITIGANSVTHAATIYIASQPTEGGTSNSAIRFGSIANISGTTSITFNEDSEDVDFRIESNDNANMFVIDAGLNAIGIGGAAVTSQTLTVTNTALNATAGRLAKFTGTMAAPNMGDGYGAVEIDFNASGTLAGYTVASSAWVNLASGAVPGANIVATRNDGIYLASGITATNTIAILGGRMQYVPADGADCSNIHLFDTNIYDNTLKSLFRVNAIGDMGGSTTAQTGNDYKVPLFYDVTANQLWYVNVYHS